MASKNTVLLKGLCLVAPSVLLFGAHFFPLRRLMGRDLGRLESNIVGTTAIVGAAGLAMALDDEGSNGDHVTMLGLAAFSAGFTTLAARLLDYLMAQSGKIANLEAQIGHLRNNGDL